MQKNTITQNRTIAQSGRGAIPRLAMINDISGFGRCSATVALPIISALQVQVCPVPTSILSNHLGFPLCHMDDYTPHMREYIQVWSRLKLRFDGLYCGFLGNVEQPAIIEEFLELFSPKLFLLDPVMGDHGRTYSTVSPAHCRALKGLAAKADILTPNITEACLLTDTPYQDCWEASALDLLCQRLSEQYPESSIVITGILADNQFLNIILHHHEKTTCITPMAGASRPGTGDIFASILAADALNGVAFSSSVEKASDFVAHCIRCSEAAGTPPQEGVLFERCLHRLLTP